MGARGPAPEPDRLRVLKGGRARGQPHAVPDPGEVPDWLPGRAVEMWDRVVPELQRLGLISRIDLAVLAEFCVQWALWRDSLDDIAANGPTIPGARGRGERVKNPAVTVANGAADRMRSCAVQLGLTPAARLRMTLPDVDDQDEADQVFGRVPAGRGTRG